MKRCGKCNKNKDFSDFYSYSLKNSIAYRRTCKQCEIKNSGKQRRTSNPYGYHRKSLLKKYGITAEQHTMMLEEQGSACGICGALSLYLKETLNIDHCHTTGKVRGLLCANCNKMLGNAKDNIKILLDAAKYLEQRGNGYGKLYGEEPIIQPKTDEIHPSLLIDDEEARMPSDSEMLFWSVPAFDEIAAMKNVVRNKTPEDDT